MFESIVPNIFRDCDWFDISFFYYSFGYHKVNFGPLTTRQPLSNDFDSSFLVANSTFMSLEALKKELDS